MGHCFFWNRQEIFNNRNFPVTYQGSKVNRKTYSTHICTHLRVCLWKGIMRSVVSKGLDDL
jgi:hypothetical protein